MDTRKDDYETITAVWHLLRDYGDLKADGENARWMKMGDEAERISQRGQMAKDMVLAVMEEIDRRAIAQRKEAQANND